MAWTTPRTWTDGEGVTAALFNTHVRDNIAEQPGSAVARGAKGYKSAGNQSVNSSVATKVTMTSESWDTNSEYDTGNSRFTATETMKVVVIAQVTVDGVSGYVWGSVYKNGSSKILAQYYHNTGIAASLMISGALSLVATDYLELYVYHEAGIARNVLSAETYTFMSIQKVA